MNSHDFCQPSTLEGGTRLPSPHLQGAHSACPIGAQYGKGEKGVTLQQRTPKIAATSMEVSD